jgi:methylamine dehydrogenase accessory protein MauD
VACVALALARQIGILHARIGPMGARMTNAGPEIGDAAPPLDVVDIAGRAVTLAAERGKRTLLLFVSPGCPQCAELLPAVRTWHRTERDRVEIVLVSQDPEHESNETFVAQHHLTAIPVIISHELAMQYRIGVLPYAVLVDQHGRVRSKGLVNNPAHLESLLNAEELGHPSIQSALQEEHQRVDGPIALTHGNGHA